MDVSKFLHLDCREIKEQQRTKAPVLPGCFASLLGLPRGFTLQEGVASPAASGLFFHRL